VEQFDSSRCYQLLELEYGASLERIEAQWRDLTSIWHPDKHKVGTRAHELAAKRMPSLPSL
jgi:curved DNA-binding protein CbpA